MKDGKFESQAEIYQALLDRKKIRIIGWRENSYMFMGEDGNTYYQDMSRADMRFCSPDEWSLYEEPKKVTKYYRCLQVSGIGYVFKYFSEVHIETVKIVKKYDDYILIDEDGKLVEEVNNER